MMKGALQILDVKTLDDPGLLAALEDVQLGDWERYGDDAKRLLDRLETISSGRGRWPFKLRLEATLALLDRGYGRPVPIDAADASLAPPPGKTRVEVVFGGRYLPDGTFKRRSLPEK